MNPGIRREGSVTRPGSSGILILWLSSCLLSGCDNSDFGKVTVGRGMIQASEQEIKECEGVVSLFANALLGRNYQMAYSLTSTSYQNTVRYDAFIRNDQEMQVSTGGPTSWELPGNARVLADSGQGSFIIFRSRMEDGQTLGAYATYVTFEKDKNEKCRLGNIQFTPWTDVSVGETQADTSSEPADTFFEDSWAEDE